MGLGEGVVDGAIEATSQGSQAAAYGGQVAGLGPNPGAIDAVDRAAGGEVFVEVEGALDGEDGAFGVGGRIGKTCTRSPWSGTSAAGES